MRFVDPGGADDDCITFEGKVYCVTGVHGDSGNGNGSQPPDEPSACAFLICRGDAPPGCGYATYQRVAGGGGTSPCDDEVEVEEEQQQGTTVPVVSTLDTVDLVNMAQALRDGTAKQVNQCAAERADATSLASTFGATGRLGQILLSNDVATASQLVFGPGRGDAAFDLVLNNPVDKANATGLATRAALNFLPGGRSTVEVRMFWMSFQGPGFSAQIAGITAVTKPAPRLAGTIGGRLFESALEMFSIAKLPYDAITYGAALVGCSR